MLNVIRYNKDLEAQWNSFIAQSKNGTFLFNRRYMDYHADRFVDCSLMFYRKDRLYAVLPANVVGDTLYSHQGLTYGGLILDNQARTADIIQLFAEMNEWLRNHGISNVVYKPVPWIYCNQPSEEDLFALVKECNAQLVSREISTAVSYNSPIPFTEQRRRGLNKAKRNGIVVKPSNDLSAFWKILSTNLQDKYGLSPVHTYEEMRLLMDAMPNNIMLYMAYLDEEPLGGTIVYLCSEVVHTQYISATPKGKQLGALDIVFDFLINEYNPNKHFLDFGKSTEDHGHYLNENLIHQKEGFGGRGVCYDTYEWTL